MHFGKSFLRLFAKQQIAVKRMSRLKNAILFNQSDGNKLAKKNKFISYILFI